MILAPYLADQFTDLCDDIYLTKPLQISLCHCRECRKATGGTTSLNLTVPSSAFILKSGNLRTVTKKHLDEGFEFSLSFCEECGSPIYTALCAQPSIKIIQAGTLDDEFIMETVPAVELNIWKRVGWMNQVDLAEQKNRYT